MPGGEDMKRRMHFTSPLLPVLDYVWGLKKGKRSQITLIFLLS
jgi:hypothetical protein